MSDNRIMALYRKTTRLPFGNVLFSRLAARKAPYFTSISPLVLSLEPNSCDVLVKKRRRLENHIGTVHVIAIANGLEMAMGFMAEATIPAHLRWIPKGMSLQYPGKAASDILCTARADPASWQPGDLNVDVVARDSDENPVVTGTIKLWISEKKPSTGR